MTDGDDGTGAEEQQGHRKDYYLSIIRDIVEEQKEFLGEKAALKQARRAPLHIDKDGDVVDFYGNGQKALETLRSFTEHQELYLQVIQSIVDTFCDFLGEKTALSRARKAPLFIDKDGHVAAYYGSGRNALDIVVDQFESLLGQEVARIKIQAAVRACVPESKLEVLPERVCPTMDGDEEDNCDEPFVERLFGELLGGVVLAAELDRHRMSR